MPNKDGTGPNKKGPKTGKGLGNCKPNKKNKSDGQGKRQNKR